MAQLTQRRKARTVSRLGGKVKPGVAALLVAGVVATGVVGIGSTGYSGGFDVRLDTENPSVEGNVTASNNEVQALVEYSQTTYVVHVDGAVLNPGVYELQGDDLRLQDAVTAAGGLVEGADTSTVNLAAPIVDGSKIHIPTSDELMGTTQPISTTTGLSTTGTQALININTASAEELCKLNGIGEATAANIIADREQNGPFTCIEDLMRVSGIGEGKFAKVKDGICV